MVKKLETKKETMSQRKEQQSTRQRKYFRVTQI